MAKSDNFEILTQIQKEIENKIDTKIGIDLDKHWEGYEIQLSEDGRVIEEINPNMQLSLGEMHTMVNKFGTDIEKQNLDDITNKLEIYYGTELEKEELYEIPIAKISSNQQVDWKIECASEYVKDNVEHFNFDRPIIETLNHINHSIEESHKEVMNGDIEYKGLYPVDETEVIYCESTGKPLQQGEEVFHIEGYGYTVAEAVNPQDLEIEDSYYTTIGYEDVEEKRLAPIRFENKEILLQEDKINNQRTPLVTIEVDEKIKNMEKDLRTHYSNYQYAKLNEEPGNAQSILKRCIAEDKYYETKLVAVNGGYVKQEEVVKIVSSVNESIKESSSSPVVSKTYNEPQRVPIGQKEFPQNQGSNHEKPSPTKNDGNGKPVIKNKRKQEAEMER